MATTLPFTVPRPLSNQTSVDFELLTAESCSANRTLVATRGTIGCYCVSPSLLNSTTYAGTACSASENCYGTVGRTSNTLVNQRSTTCTPCSGNCTNGAEAISGTTMSTDSCSTGEVLIQGTPKCTCGRPNGRPSCVAPINGRAYCTTLSFNYPGTSSDSSQVEPCTYACLDGYQLCGNLAGPPTCVAGPDQSVCPAIARGEGRGRFVGAAVGGVIGGVVLLALIVFLFWRNWKKKKTEKARAMPGHYDAEKLGSLDNTIVDGGYDGKKDVYIPAPSPPQYPPTASSGSPAGPYGRLPTTDNAAEVMTVDHSTESAAEVEERLRRERLNRYIVLDDPSTFPSRA